MFNILFITCAIVAFVCTDIAHSHNVVIKSDYGGPVFEYINAFEEFMDTDRTVEIRGLCYSACTLAINDDFRDNTCISEDAVLGFHQPSITDVYTGEVVEDASIALKVELRAYRDYFWDNYPQEVKDFLSIWGYPDAHVTGDVNEFSYMVYEDLKDFVRTCD